MTRTSRHQHPEVSWDLCCLRCSSPPARGPMAFALRPVHNLSLGSRPSLPSQRNNYHQHVAAVDSGRVWACVARGHSCQAAQLLLVARQPSSLAGQAARGRAERRHLQGQRTTSEVRHSTPCFTECFRDQSSAQHQQTPLRLFRLAAGSWHLVQHCCCLAHATRAAASNTQQLPVSTAWHREPSRLIHKHIVALAGQVLRTSAPRPKAIRTHSQRHRATHQTWCSTPCKGPQGLASRCRGWLP
jgi:hypothetical protein